MALPGAVGALVCDVCGREASGPAELEAHFLLRHPERVPRGV